MEAAAKQLPEHGSMESACGGFEHAIEQREHALRDIDAQIAQLQPRRVVVSKEHGLVIDAAKQRHYATWSANTAAMQKLTDEVDERFQDMVGCWHSAQWQRPEAG